MSAQILVVDDEASIRRLLQTLLTSEGYDVRTASNGDQAWRDLRRTEPDLIVLDLMMPGMPPVDFVKEVRALADIPILVLSANHASIEIGLLIGADDAMEKPFDPDELLERIAGLLKSHEKQETS